MSSPFAVSAEELGPIGTEEAKVADLVGWVHRTACVPQAHDPFCNTLRLLVEDWKNLSTRRP